MKTDARPLPFRRRTARRGWRHAGVAAVEFAIVLPFLAAAAVGLAQFGWLLANYVMLVNAASTGARYFATQRGSSTPVSSTLSQAQASAAMLNAGNLSMVTTVAGVQCTGDSACATALTAAQGGEVTVQLSYAFTPMYKGNLYGLGTIVPTTLSNAEAARLQ